MKIVLMGFMVLVLSGCSTLITSGDLRRCKEQCQEKGIEKLCKKEGKANCSCKE